VCVFSFYTELLSAGILQPLDCLIEGLKQKEGSKDYVAPLGMGSLVKHFLSESGKHTCPPTHAPSRAAVFHLDGL